MQSLRVSSSKLPLYQCLKGECACPKPYLENPGFESRAAWFLPSSQTQSGSVSSRYHGDLGLGDRVTFLQKWASFHGRTERSIGHMTFFISAVFTCQPKDSFRLKCHMVEATSTVEAMRSRVEGIVSQAIYARSKSDILYRSGTVKRPKKTRKSK